MENADRPTDVSGVGERSRRTVVGGSEAKMTLAESLPGTPSESVLKWCLAGV
jgi:hypothetical protein